MGHSFDYDLIYISLLRIVKEAYYSLIHVSHIRIVKEAYYNRIYVSHLRIAKDALFVNEAYYDLTYK